MNITPQEMIMKIGMMTLQIDKLNEEIQKLNEQIKVLQKSDEKPVEAKV